MEIENPLSENVEIKFVGLEDTKLSNETKDNLKNIASNETVKLQRAIDEEFGVTLHIKEYDKESKKQRYGLYMRINTPGQKICSDRSQRDSWDIETALKKSFDSIKHKLEKDKRK